MINNTRDRRPLNPRQQQFAAEYFYLVRELLEQYDLDGYLYDAVLDSYLDAVQEYTENRAQYVNAPPFKVIAKEKMIDSLAQARKEQEKRRYRAREMSLDEVLRGTHSLTLKDVIPSREPDVGSVVEMHITVEHIQRELPDLQIKMLKLLLAGYNPGEIARKTRININVVSRELQNLRDVIQYLLRSALD